MRKLLLATVAGLAASVGVASAQTTPPAITVAPSTTAMTSPGSVVPTQPGTVVIRLNGRVNFYAAAFSNGSAGKVEQAATATTAAGPTSISSVNFGTYARLFPGFDGIAANGMKYGAAIEIRNTGVLGLFYQRAYGYLGTDQLGTLRLGYADSPVSLMLTGTQESFNDGGWDGDQPGLLAGGDNYAIGNGNLPLWPVLGDYGNLYATSKVVYMSPSFAGFDFGLAFEPSSASKSVNSYCTTGSASPTCAAIQSTPGGLDQRRNTGDIAGRYQGTFGAVGLAAYADYLGGSSPSDSSTPNVGKGWSGLSVVSGGVSVTIGGLEFGGWGQGGQYNMDDAAFLKPKGTKDGSAYIAGAQYTFGPVVAGVQWFDSWDAGNQNATNKIATPGVGAVSAINEYGVAAGGTYTLAPGVAVYLSYLWGVRKEAGWDFVAGAAGATHNKTFAQLIGVGTQFTW